jgi:hypothetical protein
MIGLHRSHKRSAAVPPHAPTGQTLVDAALADESQAPSGGIGHVGAIQVTRVGSAIVEQHDTASGITGILNREGPAIRCANGPVPCLLPGRLGDSPALGELVRSRNDRLRLVAILPAGAESQNRQ